MKSHLKGIRQNGADFTEVLLSSCGGRYGSKQHDDKVLPFGLSSNVHNYLKLNHFIAQHRENSDLLAL